jgi:hypothetical protein
MSRALNSEHADLGGWCRMMEPKDPVMLRAAVVVRNIRINTLGEDLDGLR